MPVATPRADVRWHAVVEEHQVALAAYLDTAARVPDGAWTRPWSAGKWTPAQITEHLTMTYRVFIGEVNGGPAMKLKLTPFRRRMLKLLMLPHMLFHRTFPRGARAPREVRPPDDAPLPAKAEALARMRELGERFEREVVRARAGGWNHVTHPYFGEIDLTRGLRLCAVHIEHHQRQLASIKS
jgi:hypothetical protein